jgi:protein Mpv17
MAVLEGTDPKQKLERSYTEALKSNYLLWPFVQMVNFKLVPLEHRVLVVNLVSIGWNCYLSWLNSRS